MGSNLNTCHLGECLNKLWYINSTKMLQKNDVDLCTLTKRSLRHIIGEKSKLQNNTNDTTYAKNKNTCTMSNYIIKCIERVLEKCIPNQ